MSVEALQEGDLSSVKPLFTDRIIHIELITDVVFSYCSPATLLRIARTCRAAHSAIHAYIRSTFRIDRLLSRFFQNPLSFRSLQARTGTLISGSVALQFFDGTSFPASDLDLYVFMQHCGEVGLWLLAEGYSYVQGHSAHADFESALGDANDAPVEVYNIPGVARVFTFAKTPPDGKELKVQLIMAINVPMAVVLGFHSTCVMNVITYEKAYCLFPKATLEQHRTLASYSCLGRNPRRHHGLLKYVERGFKIVVSLPLQELYLQNPSWSLGMRRMDDGRSWVIPLDTEGIDRRTRPNASTRALTHDPAAVTTWFVNARGDYNGGTFSVTMEFDVIGSPHLEYKYVLAMSDPDWETRYLTQKMRERIDRNRRQLGLLYGSVGQTYFDGELPEFLNTMRAFLNERNHSDDMSDLRFMFERLSSV
ncbi:uncharacterized protein LAESUDRAFT_700278 [Laetiporus sulphureus 93-53]|uniref:F-box domain-containing protein n=1 Tax=Laetiporus sulphureus 93-53 TaxID=1314785 RepID=A0A165E8J8_9APHY|nr:uncharacterized protein LAESUDRAFT_700278 [Laetiporus sulphureus 93-53]KZT06467.1 hypothetical protein LAESUDRAFT_700278 [Laetiporus sulphureus 93-53]